MNSYRVEKKAAVLKDDTELFKRFMDNESFKRWITDTVFNLTYTPTAQNPFTTLAATHRVDHSNCCSALL
ncbi:hypothetical protein [Nitrospira sp. Nam80]